MSGWVVTQGGGGLESEQEGQGVKTCSTAVSVTQQKLLQKSLKRYGANAIDSFRRPFRITRSAFRWRGHRWFSYASRHRMHPPGSAPSAKQNSTIVGKAFIGFAPPGGVPEEHPVPRVRRTAGAWPMAQ